MASHNHIEYFKRGLLDFLTERDLIYAMRQWMTEKITQREAEAKGVSLRTLPRQIFADSLTFRISAPGHSA